MRQGEIWLIKIPSSVGHEYFKDRPALIIQSDFIIKKSNVCTIIPLTSNIGNRSADDIIIESDDKNRLYCDSLLKVSHLYSFDRSRFVKKIGEVDKNICKRIKKYLRKHFDIIYK
jgi:mRNA-degrading endonuclease toxin of MazEF toxin-antitoxin module